MQRKGACIGINGGTEARLQYFIRLTRARLAAVNHPRRAMTAVAHCLTCASRRGDEIVGSIDLAINTWSSRPGAQRKQKQSRIPRAWKPKRYAGTLTSKSNLPVAASTTETSGGWRARSDSGQEGAQTAQNKALLARRTLHSVTMGVAQSPGDGDEVAGARPADGEKSGPEEAGTYDP